MARMGERIANIGPKYAVRLGDLRNWHILTAVCPQCRHKARVRMWQFKVGRSDHTSLLEIQRLLRCTRCGNRESNTILVEVASRE